MGGTYRPNSRRSGSLSWAVSTLCAATVALAILSPSASAGSVYDGPTVGGAATSDGAVVTVAGGSTSGGSSGVAGTSTIRCRYFNLADTINDNSIIHLDIGTEATSLNIGTRYWKICIDTTTGTQVSRDLFDPSVADPAAVARTLAEQALAQLRVTPPAAETNPPNGQTVINVPTWLWVNNWQPISASASAAGVTATATATPLEISWNPGDGSRPIRCAGPGTPYNPSRPARAQSTNCSFTYTRSVGAFTITATQHWQLTYTATNGQSGNLGTVTSTATLPIDVHQLVTSIELDDR